MAVYTGQVLSSWWGRQVARPCYPLNGLGNFVPHGCDVGQFWPCDKERCFYTKDFVVPCLPHDTMLQCLSHGTWEKCYIFLFLTHPCLKCKKSCKKTTTPGLCWYGVSVISYDWAIKSRLNVTTLRPCWFGLYNLGVMEGGTRLSSADWPFCPF